MRVPGEALLVVVGVLGLEVIEQEEGIELRDFMEAEHPPQVDAGTLEGRLALPDLPDRAEHVGLLHGGSPGPASAERLQSPLPWIMVHSRAQWKVMIHRFTQDPSSHPPAREVDS